jgi:hypothetical protein
MDVRLECFKDEADAFSQCKAAGYTAHKFDFPADDNEFHWHDFDSLTFITAGELTIFDVDSGESRTCGAGTKIVGRKGVVHREQTPGFSAIIGFAEDPKTLSQPINKPLPITV